MISSSDKPVYDLSRGHPNDGLLPISEMQAITTSFLNDVTSNTPAMDDLPGVRKENNNNEENSWLRSLNYGPNAGDDRLRTALQLFLNRRSQDDDVTGKINDGSSNELLFANNDDCNTHELFITGGVSHGLELLCATLTNPGEEVWVERPTYFLAPKVFESHRLEVKPLPMLSDSVGGCDSSRGVGIGRIDIDRLIHMVEKEGVPPPKMIYVIPIYQNPTGRIMSVREREKLASFARRNNVIIVADEVYHLLDWETNATKSLEDNGQPHESFLRPARMVCFNSNSSSNKSDETPKDNDAIHSIENNGNQGCCISVSSFTKIFAPGIRLGWIEAPRRIVDKLVNYGYINSQGGISPFTGRMMAHAIESGLLDHYLDKLKGEYEERYQIICNILQEEPRIALLSDDSCARAGGYFVWVQFPPNVDSMEFLEFSMKNYGVKFMPGARCDPFASNGDDCKNIDDSDNQTGVSIQSCARLCFADLDRDKLVDGTKAFLEAFRSFLQR